MENIYNSRVLFSFHTNPEYMRPAQLTQRQVICGPLCPDIVDKKGRPSMLQTPRGHYDIGEIIEKIPPKQRPDLLVVKADATRSNLPTGIAALDIPTVLIIGDTHHMQQPLRTMMQYALSERYTYYVSDHKRHHLHYFIEAGLPNVHWAPGLLVQDWKIPFQQTRKAPLTFVGQAGKFHPWRKGILDRLSESERPLKMGPAPQEQASKVYATSTLTMNFSLNGDLNLRVFEVLAAGGCLLTDRLSWQSGLELIFRDGEHVVLYDDYDDLCAKIDYLLARPQEALAIARAGYEEFHRSHHADRKRRHLLEMAFKGWLDPIFDGKRERRSTAFSKPESAAFSLRLAQYEWLQDRHREGNRWRLLFSPKADIKLLCDLVDLPRFQVIALEPPEDALVVFDRAEVSRQIAAVSPAEVTPELACAVVCLSAADLGSTEGLSLLGRAQPQAVAITDWGQPAANAANPDHRARIPALLREKLGMEAGSPEPIGVFARPGTVVPE